MFAAGTKLSLVRRTLKGKVDLPAGFLRQYDPVYKAALCRHVRVGEGFPVFLDLFVPFAHLVFGLFYLFPEDDVGRSLGPHDGNLRLGPRQNHVRPKGLGTHAKVGAPVGFTKNHRDHGDGGFAIGVKKLGAVADDATPFLLSARKISGNVYKGEQGNVEGVAVPYETARLVRGVDVKAPRKGRGLVGDDAHYLTSNPAVAGDHVHGPEALDFEEVPVIYNLADDVVNTVPLVGVGGNHVPKFWHQPERVV